MKITPVELVGKRVILLPMEKHHAQELFNAGNSADIWTYMPMKVESMEDMEHLVGKALQAKAQGTEFPFVIFDKNAGEIVGSTRFLAISPHDKSLEVGWTWLSPAVWKTQVNTECKYLLLKHCFEVLQAVRVQIKTDGRNARSQKAIERIGAVKEGVLRQHRILADGFLRDSVYYSVIDREWGEVKEKLESMLWRTGHEPASSFVNQQLR